ncbi:uncharacterized protein LOC114915339 [Cajanus cajan]|uniref:uncharacterized protein LOC114915339 n=1 Tax=Cajanus cajan TaxID=3821 RepID=UPI0010FB9337|nr:uncharacterized protein LOC114915339 [Cajanus cajan]
MVSFSSAFFMAYYHGTMWVPIFITSLAILPITVFVFLQYPLWYDILYSTYICGSLYRPKQIIRQYVRTVQSEFSASRQRTLDRAYDDLRYVSSNLGVNDDNMANQALAFYRIALERSFTRGRRSEHVQAACLYIAFR